jgi:hypothetical protein
VIGGEFLDRLRDSKIFMTDAVTSTELVMMYLNLVLRLIRKGEVGLISVSTVKTKYVLAKSFYFFKAASCRRSPMWVPRICNLMTGWNDPTSDGYVSWAQCIDHQCNNDWQWITKNSIAAPVSLYWWQPPSDEGKLHVHQRENVKLPHCVYPCLQN